MRKLVFICLLARGASQKNEKRKKKKVRHRRSKRNHKSNGAII